MNEILQSAVCKYLSVSAFKDKWEGDKKKGSGAFYALTVREKYLTNTHFVMT